MFSPDAEPVAQAFVDVRQFPPTPLTGAASRLMFPIAFYFALRAADSASLLSLMRSTVRDIDREIAVDNVATLKQLSSNGVLRQRLYAVLLAGFAATGVSLALVGIYGTMAYWVIRRTHEIGIRMALGANRDDVLRLVMTKALYLTVFGMTLGIAGAMAVSRYLNSLLFGVASLDLRVFGPVTVAFGAVALLAAFIPARRATHIDPLMALRCE